MTQTETWTIGRLLTWTTDYFLSRGMESPRLEAEILLAEARGCERIDLYAAFHEEAAHETRVAFKELVRRRTEGTPVAYLVGRKEFYSLSFRVTPDVLIPRPETEQLVVDICDAIGRSQFPEPIRIADVGTGSGNIAISLARHCPQVRVVAIDRSAAAIEIAKLNAADHDVLDRIEFVVSDLLEELPTEPTFDFVVSNPPYVSQSEFDALSEEIRNYEPREALVAGPEGTEAITRLVAQAKQRLQPGGELLVEFSPMISQSVVLQLESQGWAEIRIEQDLAKLARIVRARLPDTDGRA